MGENRGSLEAYFQIAVGDAQDCLQAFRVSFVFNFDGKYARVREIMLQVDEDTISRATKLPIEGESWSKTIKI